MTKWTSIAWEKINKWDLVVEKNWKYYLVDKEKHKIVARESYRRISKKNKIKKAIKLLEKEWYELVSKQEDK